MWFNGMKKTIKIFLSSDSIIKIIEMSQQISARNMYVILQEIEFCSFCGILCGQTNWPNEEFRCYIFIQ